MQFTDLWVEKYRPRTLKDILLPKDAREYFESIANAKNKDIPHLLFAGRAGQGKTSLAKIIVKDILQCEYLYLNASDHNSVDVVRSTITNFIQTKSFDGKKKAIILDEADGLSSSGGSGSSAQQALRNMMEEYANFGRFILTCNYLPKITEPIRSRCQIFDIMPEYDDFMKRCIQILLTEKIEIPSEEKGNLKSLISSCYPDLRKAINNLQKYSINGKFSLNTKTGMEDVACHVFGMIENKENPFDIRKYIIDNDREFGSDYHSLMRNMFDVAYDSKLPQKNKIMILLLITEAMKDSQIVMDQELNFFSLIMKISQI